MAESDVFSTLDDDLAALDRRDAEEAARLRGIEKAARRAEETRLDDERRERQARTRQRRHTRSVVCGWLLALGIMGGITFGSFQGYYAWQRHEARLFAAWDAQCALAGGKVVGHDDMRYCAFERGAALPYNARPTR